MELNDMARMIAMAAKPPLYPEGTRVMVRPTPDEMDMGYETTTGRVVVAGSKWYVVQLDEEFRRPTNPDGYVDIREDMLLPVEVK